MPTNWNQLKHKSSPETREALRREAHAELEHIGFARLRKARKKAQVALARKLKITQGAVSRMEKQSDFLLSTLREYVDGLGGRLELRVKFAEGEFVIDTLAPESLDDERRQRTKARGGKAKSRAAA